MNFDKEFIKKTVEEYRETKSCSQATLMGLCENADCKLSKEQLSLLASGFSGGIGGTFDEGTCGALTGAVMALGLLEDDEDKIKEHSKILFELFKDKYSSVECGVISKHGKDKSPCVECCLVASEEVAILLNQL